MMFLFIQKYAYPIAGIGGIILGLFTQFVFFQGDLSKNAGIGFIIIGVLFIAYHLFRISRWRGKD